MAQHKFCPGCGSEVIGERNFCGKCGTPVKIPEANTPPPQAAQAAQAASVYQQPSPQPDAAIYQSPQPAAATTAAKSKYDPIPIACAGLGIASIFLPLVSLEVATISENITLYQALTAGSAGALLYLVMLGLVGTAICCFVKVPVAAKIISSAAAFVPIAYYGFIDKLGFITMLDSGSTQAAELFGQAVSAIDKYTGSMASSMVNQSVNLGIGAMLLLAAMAVYSVSAIVKKK